MIKRILCVFREWHCGALPASQKDAERRHLELRARFEAVNAEFAAIRRKIAFKMEDSISRSGFASLSFDGRVSPYRTPSELEMTKLRPLKALLIGECLSKRFRHEILRISPGNEVDFLLFNNLGSLPERPPVADCDFLIVQVPLRSIVPDGAHPTLSFDDVCGSAALFKEYRKKASAFS